MEEGLPGLDPSLEPRSGDEGGQESVRGTAAPGLVALPYT